MKDFKFSKSRQRNNIYFFKSKEILNGNFDFFFADWKRQVPGL